MTARMTSRLRKLPACCAVSALRWSLGCLFQHQCDAKVEETINHTLTPCQGKDLRVAGQYSRCGGT